MYGSFFMRTKSWGWSLGDKANMKILHKHNFFPHYQVPLHLYQEPSYSVVSRCFTCFSLDVLPFLGPRSFLPWSAGTALFYLVVLCCFSLRICQLGQSPCVAFWPLCSSHSTGTVALCHQTSELIFSWHLMSPVLDQRESGHRDPSSKNWVIYIYTQKSLSCPTLLNPEIPWLLTYNMEHQSQLVEFLVFLCWAYFVIVTLLSSNNNKALLKHQLLVIMKWWYLSEFVFC